jgi:hypothetical protein
MEPAVDFRVTPAEGERPGACVAFPYDRELVRRFRNAFPRARWRDEGFWWVPGVRAAARLDAWVAQELADLDAHADAKGRDDFAFEPFASPYLDVADDLIVRTPYSRAVIAALRTIPWAHWDPDERVWRVPFRSVAELRRRLPEIEAAARQAEPEARKARAAERRADPAAKRRQADRRRARYPVPAADPPPLGAPVATLFGVVVFEGSDGELLTAEAASAYPFVAEADAFVWADWREPTFRELRAIKPAPDPDRLDRGWWAPMEADIEETRARLARRYRRPAANAG